MRERPQPLWRRVVNGLTATAAVAAVGATLSQRPSAAEPEERLPEIQQGRLKEELLRQGWGEPIPQKMLKPTYWPFVLALGITFLLGGIATSFMVSGVGLFIFGLGLAGWIHDLLDEQAGNYD